jgi:Arc/MetJ family transcription regulator
MRTTVDLDDDVAAAVGRLRRESGIGVSEAVNQLARSGLTVRPERKPFVQRTARLGLKIDVTNVADALDVAEGPEHR